MKPAFTKPVAVYLLGAVALGVVWYLGLSWSRGTRRVLTESEWWNFELSPWMLALLMVMVSVALGLVFRKRIAGSRTYLQHAVLAVVVPAMGTVLLTWSVIIVGLLLGRTGEGNSVGEVLGFLVFIPFYAFIGVWHSLPVVLVLGVVSQSVMHVLARRLEAECVAQSDAGPGSA